MSEPIRVSSSKYTKDGKVEIDGNLWTVKLPGAGTELRMAQIERENKAVEARIKNLEKKLDDGNATDEEIDQYEELNKRQKKLSEETIEVYLSVFKDGTKDNASVKKWLEETPAFIQYLVFQDVKNGGEAANEPEQTEEAES